jgi:hypothetical protein
MLRVPLYWIQKESWALAIIPIAAIVLGFVFGLLRMTIPVRGFLDTVFKGSVSDDILVDIWREAHISEKSVFVRLRLKDDPLTYEGQIKKISDFSRAPIIILNCYKYYEGSDENNAIVDYSNYDRIGLALQYSRIIRMEMLYN